MKVCVLANQIAAAQQRLDEITAVVPANTLSLSYRCDPDIALKDEDDTFDLGIIVFEDLSDTRKSLGLCQSATKSCHFSIAIIAVGGNPQGNTAESLLLMLIQLKPLVDTIILAPNSAGRIPADIVTILPLLLSGSSFVGIDYSDIRFILSSGKNSAERKPNAYIIDMEPYSDSIDLMDAVTSLGRRISATSTSPIQNCLVSIPISDRKQTLTLNEAISAAEKLHGGICPSDSALVSGVPVLDPDSVKDNGLNIVCIAGHIKVTTNLINNLLNTTNASDSNSAN